MFEPVIPFSLPKLVYGDILCKLNSFITPSGVATNVKTDSGISWSRILKDVNRASVISEAQLNGTHVTRKPDIVVVRGT